MILLSLSVLSSIVILGAMDVDGVASSDGMALLLLASFSLEDTSSFNNFAAGVVGVVVVVVVVDVEEDEMVVVGTPEITNPTPPYRPSILSVISTASWMPSNSVYGSKLRNMAATPVSNSLFVSTGST